MRSCTRDREPTRTRARPHGARRCRRRLAECAPCTTASRRGEAPPGRDRTRRRADLQYELAPPARPMLFDERGLAPQKKTKTGFSTDAASLEKLRDAVARVIDPLLRTARSRSCGRPTARACSPRSPPTGASTPRSTRPWPAPAGSAPTARTCTTSRCAPRRAACSARRSLPAPGCELLVADYNQIELRCIAHLADDPGLIAAFTSGEDIHNATAARVFRSSPAASRSSSGRRRRWSRTAWPTAWRRTGSASA